MIAVFSHELKSYFHSLTAYVFGAFLLLFTGLGAMIYNINAAVSNFEYVLSYCSIVFVVIVPILTMRVLAEERKQKTDQLLYSLPITTTQVVMGKYMALLLIFLLPLGIIAGYPLIFSRFGDVYLPTAYGALFAFCLVGAAFLAVGVFISSLTESQGMAAGIGIGVLLLNYFGVTLSEYVSSTAFSSLVTILALSLLFALLIQRLTGHTRLALGIAIALCGAALAVFYADAEKLEGLLPSLMSGISLFKRFSTFVNGVFDVTAVVYFLSVIVFFLFLTVQSLEKRRYN